MLEQRVTLGVVLIEDLGSWVGEVEPLFDAPTFDNLIIGLMSRLERAVNRCPSVLRYVEENDLIGSGSEHAYGRIVWVFWIEHECFGVSMR